MDLEKAQVHFSQRFKELWPICNHVTPWIFLCSASLIDYLASMVHGESRGATGYKEFIEHWLAKLNVNYKNFTFRSGAQDLPIQMYHVLRCGIVHSFSLIPDDRARAKGGRDRSIALCHKEESDARNLPHLSNFSSGAITDAALLVAEPFLSDLEATVKLIFQEAQMDPGLRENILRWMRRHPMLAGGF